MTRLPAALLLLIFATTARGEELLPADRPMAEVIDHYVDAKLQGENVQPAPQADDANLVRRLMLDLGGRIPTAAEAKAYVAATQPDKREKLVDRLLASPEFARHQRNELERLFAYEDRSEGEFREYLLQAARDNRPWDVLFRELLLTKDEGERGSPALTFLRQRAEDPDRLTTDVSALFFGVNISCARCHDHPLVDDWKQDHYFGMKSFFNRTFRAKSGHVGESDQGIVEFETNNGEKKTAKLMFFTGAVIDEPEAKQRSDEEKKEREKQLEELAKNKQPPPAPEFSRREKLVELAVAEKEFFARNIVNRIWHRLLGHGLVNPVDQLHSANTPSHPELLAWLARDLVEHQYDLKRLIRGIVLSRAYSRSSRWESGEPPSPDLFAVAVLRPLTPRQYATALMMASTAPGSLDPAGAPPEDWEKRVGDLENNAQGIAGQFEMPGDNFQVSVNEALLLSNEQRMQDVLLGDGGDKLIGHLKKIENPRERIEAAAWNILNRAAAEEEIAAFTAYLEQRSDRADEALRQVVWAMLASSELRFNY
jgi:hypothetical protein